MLTGLGDPQQRQERPFGHDPRRHPAGAGRRRTPGRPGRAGEREGRDAEERLAEGFLAQTRRALENIVAVLTEGGAYVNVAIISGNAATLTIGSDGAGQVVERA